MVMSQRLPFTRHHFTVFVLATGLAACGLDTKTSTPGDVGNAQGGSVGAGVGVPEAPMAMSASVEMRSAPAAAMDASAAPVVSSGAPGNQGLAINQSDSITIGSVLIRQGDITVTVSHLQPALDTLRSALSPFGAMVTNETLATAAGQAPSATLVVRLPAARWDSVVAVVRARGKLEHLAMRVEDVTTQYRDAQARIQSLAALESRLTRILAERTGRLQDVLEVEREMARVRTEREQLLGQQQQWREQARLSTLTIQLQEPSSLVERPEGPSPLSRIGGDAWRRLEASLAAGLLLAATLAPWALALGGLWLWWRRRGRKRGAKEG